MENQEVKKIKAGHILSWIFGIIFVLFGMIGIVSDPVKGILFSLIGLILLPPFDKVLQKKFKLYLSRGVKTLLVLVLLLLGLLSSEWNNVPETVNKIEQVNIPAPSMPINEEDQIKALVANILGGKTNLSRENRLRNVKVVPQVDGGWGVFVDFNADENLTLNLTKLGIEKTMSEIYAALFMSGKDIKRVSAAAYFPTTDQYGNTSDSIIYKSRIESSVASKVNWSADKATLELKILPGLWETTFLNQSFR